MTVEQKAEEYRKNFNYYQDWHGQVIDIKSLQEL